PAWEDDARATRECAICGIRGGARGNRPAQSRRVWCGEWRVRFELSGIALERPARLETVPQRHAGVHLELVAERHVRTLSELLEHPARHIAEPQRVGIVE